MYFTEQDPNDDDDDDGDVEQTLSAFNRHGT
jgi:hypothetical protein